VKACGVMASCLEKLNLSRMSNSEIVDSMVFALWLCKSCDPPLLVQQESLVRTVSFWLFWINKPMS
jgi:hypothetical protein